MTNIPCSKSARLWRRALYFLMIITRNPLVRRRTIATRVSEPFFGQATICTTKTKGSFLQWTMSPSGHTITQKTIATRWARGIINFHNSNIWPDMHSIMLIPTVWAIARNRSLANWRMECIYPRLLQGEAQTNVLLSDWMLVALQLLRPRLVGVARH